MASEETKGRELIARPTAGRNSMSDIGLTIPKILNRAERERMTSQLQGIWERIQRLEAENERLKAELEIANERLRKADGMAREINILTKENRALAAELEQKRELERMVEDARKIEGDGFILVKQPSGWYGTDGIEKPQVCNTALEAYKAATSTRTEGEGVE